MPEDPQDPIRKRPAGVKQQAGDGSITHLGPLAGMPTPENLARLSSLPERLGLGAPAGDPAPDPADVDALRRGDRLEADGDPSEGYLAACRREAAHLDALEALETYQEQHEPLELIRNRLMSCLLQLTADLEAHDDFSEIAQLSAALGALPPATVDLEPVEMAGYAPALSSQQLADITGTVWRAVDQAGAGTGLADQAADTVRQQLTSASLA